MVTVNVEQSAKISELSTGKIRSRAQWQREDSFANTASEETTYPSAARKGLRSGVVNQRRRLLSSKSREKFVVFADSEIIPKSITASQGSQRTASLMSQATSTRRC